MTLTGKKLSTLHETINEQDINLVIVHDSIILLRDLKTPSLHILGILH